MTTATLLSLFSSLLHALFSLHFIILAGMILVLTRKSISPRAFSLLSYVCIVTYLFFFYGKHSHIFTMAGDNLCQIAYWKILFHGTLAGSIGASFTKPGHLLILGGLYELSRVLGETAFTVGICLVFSSCVWILSKIAADIGGRWAGIGTFLISIYVFIPEFYDGSNSIFLVPVLYAGLRFYYYDPCRRNLGMLLLVLDIQFHIQAITVLAIVWLIHAAKREWRQLALFSAAASASLALWVAVIMRVQGTVTARLNSGASVGYIAPFGEAFAYKNKLEYLTNAVTTQLAASYSIKALFILAAIGIAGAIYYRRKAYLAVFSTVILLMLNVVMFGGTINLGRYFSPVFAFGCSIGVATLVSLVGDRHKRYAFPAVLLLLIPFVVVMEDSAQTHGQSRQLPDYVAGAASLLQNNSLPYSTRLMTEDDLLYPIVVQYPDRYQKLEALQQFNIEAEPERRKMLAATDYIWIAANNRHMYYYLAHTPLPDWHHDPFRLMVLELQRSREPKKMYGFCFFPIESDTEHLLIQVKPDTMPHQCGDGTNPPQ